MRVLQINAIYEYLSTGRITKELHDALGERGIESYVACSVIPNRDEDIYKIGTKFDAKIHALASRITGMQGYFSFGSTKKLLKYMDKIKPDVVLLGNLHSNFIHIPMLLKYLAAKQIATVIVLHDCWFYTGKCVYYTLTGCERWKDSCGNCPALEKGNPSWFFDFTAKMLSDKVKHLNKINQLAIVGVSDWITGEVRRSLIAKNAKIIRRIYNWIDLEEFSPHSAEKIREQLHLRGKFIILGVASTWGEPKGLNSFLELSSKLNENQFIVLVGEMPKGIKLNNNVISVGRVHSVKALAEYYNMADVFVTFSLEETFGKVSAEALSCGTPVVCYQSTANEELVGEGCGYVVPEKDMNAFVQAIQKVYENGKEQYSAGCRDYAVKFFDKNERIQDYIEVMEQLVETGKGLDG